MSELNQSQAVELNDSIDAAKELLSKGRIVNAWMNTGWYTIGMANHDLPDIVCHAVTDVEILDQLVTYILENVPMEPEHIFEYPMISPEHVDEPARFKFVGVADGSIEEYLPMIPMLAPNAKLIQLLLPDNYNRLPGELGYNGQGQPLFSDTPDYLEMTISIDGESDEDESTDSDTEQSSV